MRRANPAIITPIIVWSISVLAKNIIPLLPSLEVSLKYPDNTLLRATDTVPVYTMKAGQRRWIPNPETLRCMYPNYQIKSIYINELNHIPKGPHLPSIKDSVFINKIGTSNLYKIKNCKRIYITDDYTVNEPQNLDENAIQHVYEDDLNDIPEAAQN